MEYCLRAKEREINGRIRNQEMAMGTAGEELPGRVPSFSVGRVVP